MKGALFFWELYSVTSPECLVRLHDLLCAHPRGGLHGLEARRLLLGGAAAHISRIIFTFIFKPNVRSFGSFSKVT